MSRELLRVLSVKMARSWHDIITLDKSWIDFYCDHDLMWMAPGEIVPDREWQSVQSPKLMLTIVWNPIGIHIVKSLPKGGKFSAQYYTNNILLAISDWRRLAGERARTSYGPMRTTPVSRMQQCEPTSSPLIE
jgi:hypothetical protein